MCGAKVLQCIADDVKLRVYVKRKVVEKRSVEDMVTEDPNTNVTDPMDTDHPTNAEPIKADKNKLGKHLKPPVKTFQYNMTVKSQSIEKKP